MRRIFLMLSFLLMLGGCEGCLFPPDILTFDSISVSSGCAQISGRVYNNSKNRVDNVRVYYTLSPSGSYGYTDLYFLGPYENKYFTISPSIFSEQSSVDLEISGDDVSGEERTLSCY